MNRHAMTPASAARWAGIGYIAIVILAIGANFLVRNPLVIPDDPAATMANIGENQTVFRFGIAAFTAIAMIDIFIAWALHVLLRGTGEHRSLLAAWLRIAYAVAFIPAITFMTLALEIAAGGALVAGLDVAQREAWTGLAMEAFDVTWLLALVAFGLHLIVIARIVISSRIAPRALGWAVSVAGGAYIVDTFAHLLLSDYASYADVMLAVVAIPSIVAELWLTGWLLVRAPRAVEAHPVAERTRVPA